MKDFMEENRNVLLYSLILCVAIVVLLVGQPEDIIAQPGLPNDPEQTPIDGGLAILAALGGAYGIKKLRDEE